MHFITAITALAGLALAAPAAISLDKRGACDPEAPGISGTAYDLTSPEAFAAYGNWTSMATEAATPDGYTNVFTDKQASNKLVK